MSRDWICRACGDSCEVIKVDVGVGAYEYWGAKGNDVRIESRSDCCEADYVDALLLSFEQYDEENAPPKID
jgi:hypothetical protein